MLRGEKGEALLAVLLLAALIFIVGGAAVAMGTTVRKTAVYEIRQKKAYYIAEAGVERVLAYIDAHPEALDSNEHPPVVSDQDYGDGKIVWADFTKESQNVELENATTGEKKSVDLGTGTKIVIESTGRFPANETEASALFGKAERTITTEALVTTPADLLRGLAVLEPGTDPFEFRGSFNFEGSDAEPRAAIIWNGSVDFTPGEHGKSVSLEHVDIYASGDIILPEQSGGGECGGNVVDDVYVYKNCPYVPAYPLIDLQWYRDHAAQSYSGDTTFSQGDTLPEGIVFVEGNVTIASGFEYTGDTMIVAEGDITVEGHLKKCCGGSGESGGSGVLVLMAPNGTVSLGGCGKVEVEAFIVAREVKRLHGKQKVTGGVLTKDLDFTGEGSGNVTIKADPEKLQQLVAETDFLQGIRLDVKLTSWREGS